MVNQEDKVKGSIPKDWTVSAMAVSNGNVLKRPKVVEESDTSNSDDSQSEEEEQELEPGDMEIKEEVDDDYLDDFNPAGESFTAFSTDEDFTEIKEEDEEEEKENEAESSANETKTAEHSKKNRTRKVKNEAEPDSDDSDDMDEDFEKIESEEDNFGDDESEEGEGDEDNKSSGSGLANMMAKILGTKKSGDVILSKAKTDTEVKKSMKKTQEDTFEIVDSSGQIKTEPVVDKIKKEEEEEKEVPVSLHERELYRKVWEEKFRKKPSIMEDREKERKLRVLATQGVVQLFSAIEKHRTMMQVKLSQCRSIMGREKVLESTGKEAFLDILKQQGKRVKKDTNLEGKVKNEDDNLVKEEVKDELLDLQPPMKKKPKWNVFSDNFYKEPTLHGWDQQSDDGDD